MGCISPRGKLPVIKKCLAIKVIFFKSLTLCYKQQRDLTVSFLMIVHFEFSHKQILPSAVIKIQLWRFHISAKARIQRGKGPPHDKLHSKIPNMLILMKRAFNSKYNLFQLTVLQKPQYALIFHISSQKLIYVPNSLIYFKVLQNKFLISSNTIP